VSKKQSRMSLSISRELGQALVAFAETHTMPVAQVASRFIEAGLAGEVALGPPQESRELAISTWRRRGFPGAVGITREELERRVAERDEARKAHEQLVRDRAAARARAARPSKPDRLDLLTAVAPPVVASRAEPKPTCAICTDEIDGPPRIEPMGRDGAEVKICNTCATEPPNCGRYSFGGTSSRGMTDGSIWISGSSRRSALGSR
jgi:hypothetical protein